MVKALQNYLVFKTNFLFNEHAKFKGVGGRELVIDTSFEPARHCRIYGEVTSVPKYLSNVPISQIHRGLPSYVDFSPYSYKYISDIEMEIQPGDRVYYHFNTIHPKNFVHIDGVDPNRTWYLKLRYDQAICVVRGEKIIPIGGYVLIEPDLESWDDILKPVRSTIKDKNGDFILKPKDQWLQTKVRPDRKYLTGFVKYIGTPLKGDVNELEIGQKIVYRRHADWVQKIEGTEYYAIRQRHIVGKFDNGFVPVNGNIGLRGIDKPTVTEAGVNLTKAPLTSSGYVVYPGKSGLQVNDQVEIADSDRLEVELDKVKYLITHANYVLGVHEKA